MIELTAITVTTSGKQAFFDDEIVVDNVGNNAGW
jgi:hypothetical protein